MQLDSVIKSTLEWMNQSIKLTIQSIQKHGHFMDSEYCVFH